MEAVATAPAKTEVLVSPLRLLFVVPRAQGGLARHVLELLRHLDRRRFLPLVACPPKGSVAQEAEGLGVEVSPLSIGPGGSRCLFRSWTLARLASSLKADIVHAHGLNAGLTAAWARRLAPSARLICTLHSFPPSCGWATRRALRAIAARAERVIAVSEALARAAVELGGRRARVVVIPNGVELEAAAGRSDVRAWLSLPAEAKLVGMVARLAPQKGVDIFIEAARLAGEQMPGLRFILAGEGPLRAAAEAQVRSLGLEGRLILTGHWEKARELIRELDLLVVASTSEGSPLAPLEAMAEGKPVVAAAAGGVPEIVKDGETGRLVAPGEPSLLAAAMVEVLSDPQRARALGAAGRRRAGEEFSLRQMVGRTQELYEEVFARG